ncbi:MAG TPA: isoaspartyl peptidase/L-asparaginase family protein [Myxococcaceae bacterium]|nr:isoaspartyl peptidase/L-asparaginase family protein [Myxococcaceae bacterium]
MKPAVLVHGGAGPAHPEDDSPSCRAGCLTAARAAYAVLSQGGSALDAVVAAAVTLEDDPQFNAGTGASLNQEGAAELDASLMDGRTRGAGAVAGVRDVKNPIRLARAVMERTRHVLIAGEGASQLADEVGIPRCDPASLVTPRARARWERAAQKLEHGTIGAVAIDAQGHLAAATSTGGTSQKHRGRIGDAPVIGAGTYADDRGGAVSMTGPGEPILRAVAAKLASDLLRAGASPQTAAAQTVSEVAGLGGECGVILVDSRGRTAFAFSTPRLSRAWIDGEGVEGSGYEP